MRETKAGKCGRFLAIFVNYSISNMPEEEGRRYSAGLSMEVSDSELRDELAEIDKFNPASPEHAGKLMKQVANLQYNMNTRKNTLEGFLKEL